MRANIIPARDYKMITKQPRTKREENLQLMVCNYLRISYPDVIFTSDASGVRLTQGQAGKMKAMKSVDCKFPDLMIFEPRGIFKGLFLELKSEGEKVFKVDGTPYAGHLHEQWRTLQRLAAKGYYAKFAIGFDDAKAHIDNYMR